MDNEKRAAGSPHCPHSVCVGLVSRERDTRLPHRRLRGWFPGAPFSCFPLPSQKPKQPATGPRSRNDIRVQAGTLWKGCPLCRSSGITSDPQGASQLSPSFPWESGWVVNLCSIWNERRPMLLEGTRGRLRGRLSGGSEAASVCAWLSSVSLRLLWDTGP